jgi:hypothetical protein
MSQRKDQNDRLRDGTLPEDPFQGKTVSSDVPRIFGERDMLCSVSTAPEKTVHGTTGHAQLDYYTGGLRPNDVWLCGADTSWGKSSAAIMIYDENKRRRKSVLICSAEDSLETYGARLMRRRTRIPAQALRNRHLNSSQHAAVAEAKARSEMNAAFIDARGRAVEWLAPRVTRAIKEYAIDIVIYDYVGAFECKQGQQDRRNMTRYIARVMADTAKTAGACGIIMSQITLSDEEQIPGKFAYRDSKDLLHMAEVGLMGYLAPKAIEGKCAAGDRMLKIVKCKEGEAGKSVVMAWDPVVACFDATADEREPEPDPWSGALFEDQLRHLAPTGAEANS